MERPTCRLPISYGEAHMQNYRLDIVRSLWNIYIPH
jgi:hypothetical protein